MNQCWRVTLGPRVNATTLGSKLSFHHVLLFWGEAKTLYLLIEPVGGPEMKGSKHADTVSCGKSWLPSSLATTFARSVKNSTSLYYWGKSLQMGRVQRSGGSSRDESSHRACKPPLRSLTTNVKSKQFSFRLLGHFCTLTHNTECLYSGEVSSRSQFPPFLPLQTHPPRVRPLLNPGAAVASALTLTVWVCLTLTLTLCSQRTTN